MNKKIRHNEGVIVNNFLEDKNGFLWAATDGRGLWQYDQNKKLVHQYKSDPRSPDSLFHNDLGSLFQGRSDTMWLGGFRGLGIFNTKTKVFSQVLFDTTFKAGDIHPITGIYPGQSGSVWITRFLPGERGESALIQFKPQDQSFKNFIPENPKIKSFRFTNIASFLEDRSGDIWAGARSATGGVSWLNRKTGKVRDSKDLIPFYMKIRMGLFGRGQTGDFTVLTKKPTSFYLFMMLSPISRKQPLMALLKMMIKICGSVHHQLL
jgi:ligand-binding sensor domain-containing protein